MLFKKKSFAAGAMVGGLYGLLFLLVGTCSAWHDSYHGEHLITRIMTLIMVNTVLIMTLAILT